MVYLLLKEGHADTNLEDAYGKKALDRAHSSHISYLIATASIENRMKDMSQTLNLNEYSPEGRRSKEGGANEQALSDRTPNAREKFRKSVLLSSGKKILNSPYSQSTQQQQ